MWMFLIWMGCEMREKLWHWQIDRSVLLSGNQTLQFNIHHPPSNSMICPFNPPFLCGLFQLRVGKTVTHPADFVSGNYGEIAVGCLKDMAWLWFMVDITNYLVAHPTNRVGGWTNPGDFNGIFVGAVCRQKYLGWTVPHPLTIRGMNHQAVFMGF